eukprot:CAMPEP_0198320738 /NCGR_PEP_ID=MMETSP1450-20131203/9604_1 /TAXON_ID=753684 ORGANISM="Madagascaria erythrocladiodes, Strain CCMP3234" /NCGR_SAMPLE_ID=MMETSP1450 /ASSEMBLY_ACC=CAM_ASM_001115 /LENGTH=311 /DNA_ID=CAMNT_0044024231 /DNA_START=53 /DNA_END=988 /DNA_ORIENTATION=-
MAAQDNRSVERLLLHFRPALDKLAESLSSLPEFTNAPYDTDDLFLLRYLLSGSVSPTNPSSSSNLEELPPLPTPEALKKAEGTVRQAVAFRAQNAGWMAPARSPMGVAPHSDKLAKHLVGSHHGYAKDESPIYVVRSAHTSAKQLWSTGATVEQVTEWATFRKEALFWKCDEITRRTGRITKCIYVIDLKGGSIVQDIRGGRAFGSSTKLSDFLHPQMIEKTVILHPPTSFRLLYQFAKAFVSKKSLDKIRQCSATDHRKADIAKCPFVSERLEILEVPSFMGGGCRCNDGCCINGIPNDKKNCMDNTWSA